MDTHRPIRRALLSVSDKTGIVEFARALEAQGVDILSTGGTCKLLADNGIKVTEVDLHSFPTRRSSDLQAVLANYLLIMALKSLKYLTILVTLRSWMVA